MVDSADLLIELGTEELPAGSVLPLANALGNALNTVLTDAELAPDSYRVYATPRRIAVWFNAVPSMQQGRSVQKKGPALAAAFDAEDNPTKALQGFARSNGVSVDELTRQKTDKGEWMVHTVDQPGQSLADVVAEHLKQIVKQLPMPKRMRWSDKKDEFLRPVLWLLALYGDDVLPLSVLGLTADRVTYGHRFHAPAPIHIERPDQYAQVLHKAYVIADFEARKELIRRQVIEAADAADSVVVIDDDLLDEVTALVEWPVAIAGSFEPEFLTIPKEALIQTMEENQRYFALVDNDGNLKPGFITIANLESSNPEIVRQGNERVIRPRFKDTMFFWNNDVSRQLISHRDNLKKVLFQKKLGTVYDKSERLMTLSEFIASETGASVTDCRAAAELSKCDLLTDIVNDLPKMQGIAGRRYAELEGYPESVSIALEEQYLPKQAGGSLPQSAVGQVLAIADKTDTLIGIFGIGQKPTGAKDPFGLRRASLGILRILIEKQLPVDLRTLFSHSTDTFGQLLNTDFDNDAVLDYALERLKGYYQEKGESMDVVDAVLSKGITVPLDFDHRVRAVAKFRRSDAAASLSAANKRIRNILKKIGTPVPDVVDRNMLTEPAEESLARSLEAVAAEIEPHYAASDYAGAMTTTARLREPVDSFFNDVMVMVDDDRTRNNRLALLKQVGDLCSRTADLSVLQPESTT